MCVYCKVFLVAQLGHKKDHEMTVATFEKSFSPVCAIASRSFSSIEPQEKSLKWQELHLRKASLNVATVKKCSFLLANWTIKDDMK